VRQPEGVGPVLFSNSSPSYVSLQPLSEDTGPASGVAGGDDSGMGAAGIVVIVLVALVLAGAAWWVVMRRRTADERE
jgi:hypothetical protein